MQKETPVFYPRRGVVLVIVLVVITLLTLSVLAFSKFMLAERKGTHQSLRQRQVRLLAESGTEYLRVALMKEPYIALELGGFYDNPAEFCGHIVTDGTIAMTGSGSGYDAGLRNGVDLTDLGRFSVIAPRMNNDGTLDGSDIRYGLEDESAKINLRWLMELETEDPGSGKAILMKLPGVTEDIADAILDWMDGGNETREYGAEDDYYAGLDPPYYTRNGIPDSVDELLLVAGVTPKLLYGIDWNRNGILDLGEPSEDTLADYTKNGDLNLGLAAYLTVDSKAPTVSSQGVPKINVNMEDTDELQTQLEERFEEEWVEAILAARQNGTLASLLDLVSESGAGGGTATSPFSDDPDEMNKYMPQLYDNLMLGDTPDISENGKINLNQAPRTVLEAFLEEEDALAVKLLGLTAEDARTETGGGGIIPLLTQEILEDILAERISDPALVDSDEMNYMFWVYTHGLVDFSTMKVLEQYFCGRGAVFKANIVARFDEASPTVRQEVWLDSSTPNKPAKVIRVRNLDGLGPGYTAEMLGADEYSRQTQ